MWDLAVREDDYTAVDSMLARFSGAPLSYRIVPAYARADSAAITRLREEARVLDARQSQIAARYVATYLENRGAAEELARLDLAAAAQRRDPPWRANLSRLARGGAGTLGEREDELRCRGTHGRRRQRPSGASARRHAAFSRRSPRRPGIGPSRHRRVERVRAGAGELESRVAASSPLSTVPAFGLLSSRLEDDERANAYAAEIDKLTSPAGARTVVTGLAATVRADVALRRGNAAQALELLSPVGGAVPLELVYVKPFVNVREYAQEHARYLRAQALLATGRTDDARRWFENSFQGSPVEMAYLAPMHAALGEILDRAGSHDAAATHWKKFIALWGEADAALKPQVDAARATVRGAAAR